MKFLLFSQCGEGAQILKRIELEGNEVGLFIKDKLYSTVFDGLLPKVEPDDFIDKNTVILFDMSGNGKIADRYKRQGLLVFGASEFADKLEHDRQFGFDAMLKAGIKIPEHKEFTDFALGMDFVRKSNKRLVFKPSGSMPCKLTYVSKNAEELEAYLNFVEQHFSKDIESFILQDFIEGSVVSSEFFCNGHGFMWPPNHTVEVKKSMNDDLGPSTGCSGNITWTCEESSKVITQGVAKIESLCASENYAGQVDLNAVVNESGVYGLEWTPRFGYDATPTLLTLLRQDFGEFFHGLASGQLSAAEFLKKDAGGIRVTIPPYPAEPQPNQDPEKFSPSKGVPIQNYEKHAESLYFYEVCSDNTAALSHSGGTGVIACAMGLGDTPEECLEEPYKILKELQVPDKQYRTDLVKVLSKMVKETLIYV
jgi:phosphoribosylamine---glycine ligase